MTIDDVEKCEAFFKKIFLYSPGIEKKIRKY